MKDIGGHLGPVCATCCHRSILPARGSPVYRRDAEGSEQLVSLLQPTRTMVSHWGKYCTYTQCTNHARTKLIGLVFYKSNSKCKSSNYEIYSISSFFYLLTPLSHLQSNSHYYTQMWYSQSCGAE